MKFKFLFAAKKTPKNPEKQISKAKLNVPTLNTLQIKDYKHTKVAKIITFRTDRYLRPLQGRTAERALNT